MSRRMIAAMLAAGALLLAAAPTAGAAPIRSFEGSCSIAGPVVPARPINVIPSLRTSFAFHGTGTCSGLLDGKPIQQRPVRFEIPKALILFDTCELGPDLSALAGLEIPIRKKKTKKGKIKQIVASFPLSVDLLRIATVGPLLVRGPHDGQGFGTAQLMVPDPAAALAECADLSGGITDAHLQATFTTQNRFIGS